MTLKFAIIGCAGYVAPRHLKAIKKTGNELIAAYDINDSVGILDSYFPNCKFFKTENEFKKFILNNKIDFTSICSPNYLHNKHCKLALNIHSNVICEKPLVLYDRSIPILKELENKTNKKIYNILQLRLHPTIKKIKKTIDKNKFYNVDLSYITPRGDWYHKSWKGDKKKSGGIETNIGIHFFDMLIWMFGNINNHKIIYRDNQTSIGILELDNATVNFKLSINRKELKDFNVDFYRSIKINGNEIRFDNIFGDLHVISYKEIFKGKGFGIDEVIPSISLATNIRDIK